MSYIAIFLDKSKDQISLTLEFVCDVSFDINENYGYLINRNDQMKTLKGIASQQ